MMLTQEMKDYVIKVLGLLNPADIYNLFPPLTIDHFIGTDRLLGECYGLALGRLFGLSRTDNIRLSRALVLLRGYIVIDDAIKDRVIVNPNKVSIAESQLIRIKKQAINELSHFDIDSDKLFEKHLIRINRAFNQFGNESSFHCILDKCSFVFLPYDFKIFQGKKELCRLSKKYSEVFLFCLQLLDDYCDMSEDLMSRSNQNLFIGRVDETTAKEVIKRKEIMLPGLLGLIKTELLRCWNDKLCGTYFETFHNNSIAWIDKTEALLSNDKFSGIFSAKVTRYKFEHSRFINLADSTANYNQVLPDDYIRAEAMHSLG